MADWPCNATLLLNAVPEMIALLLLEGVVVDCLNLVFEDIATTTCLAGLTMPLSELPGDAPAAEIFGSLHEVHRMQCHAS